MARRELIAACGLIGALGGALFGYALQRPHTYRGSWDLVLALTGCTAISATLLGIALTRTPLADAHRAGARATALSFAFGALNGVLMVAAMALLKGAPGTVLIGIALFAAMFGGVCALPFIPAMVAVAVTAARVTARPGSIADAAQRRRILRVAALSLAIASALLPRRGTTSIWLHLPMHVANVALALIVALLFAELAALARLKKSALGPEWEPSTIDAPPDVDFGLGSERFIRRAHDETYRHELGVSAIVHGDRDRALDAVRTSLRGHSLAGGIAALALAVQCALR